MPRWLVRIAYLTAAGHLREAELEVERPTRQEAEDACVIEVLRPGREIVGTEVEEIDGG